MTRLSRKINEARHAMGEAVPAGFLKRLKAVPDESGGPEEKVVDSLKNAMDAIMGANEIVHRTKGQLTKRDKPKLVRFAADLEGAAVDIMSAAKKLP